MRKRLKHILVWILIISIILPYIPCGGVAETIYDYDFENEAKFIQWLINDLNLRVVTKKKGYKVNYNTYKKTKEIVYGSVHGRFEPIADGRFNNGAIKGEWEYLGYDKNDNDYGNSRFPNDHLSNNGTFPRNTKFNKVNYSNTSWDNIPNSAKKHMKTVGLVYEAAPWYGEAIKPKYTLSNLGGEDYVRVVSYPTWLSNGNYYTENGTSKIYHANFVIPMIGLGKNTLNCEVKTYDATDFDYENPTKNKEVKTFTIPLDKNEITLKVGVKSLMGFGEGANENQIGENTATLVRVGSQNVGASHTTSKNKESVLYYDVTITRASLSNMSQDIQLNGSAKTVSEYSSSDQYYTEASTNIRINVESNENQPTALVGMRNSDGDYTIFNGTTFKVGESKSTEVTFQNYCEPKGKEVSSYIWSIDGQTKVTYGGKGERVNFQIRGLGEHTIKLEMVTREKIYADTISFSLSQKSKPRPVKEPVARASGTDKARAGDYVYLTANGSYDPDGKIESYYWHVTGNEFPVGNVKQTVTWYSAKNLGQHVALLTVTDNDDLSANDFHYFTILPPYVYADIQRTGRLKVNRKMTLISQVDAPIKYPAKYIGWNIGLDYDSTRKTLNTETISILPKKQGLMPVHLSASNGYETGQDDKSYLIEPDVPPIADYMFLNKVVYRSPYDDLKAEIRMANLSYSTDGDYIKKVKVTYIFDANDNGVFDEPEQVGYEGKSKETLSFKVDHLGKYKVFLYVTEGFDDTFPELLTENDYLKADTKNKVEGTIVEVDNKAPLVGIKAIKKKPITLGIAVDKKGDLTRWQNAIDTILKPQLEERHIIPNITLLPYKKNTEIKRLNYIGYYKHRDSGDEDYDYDYWGNIQLETKYQSADGLVTIDFSNRSRDTAYYHRYNERGEIIQRAWFERWDIDKFFSNNEVVPYVKNWSYNYSYFQEVKVYYGYDDELEEEVDNWYPVAISKEGIPYFRAVRTYDYDDDEGRWRRIRKTYYFKYNFDKNDYEFVERSEVPSTRDWICDYTKILKFEQIDLESECIEWYEHDDGRETCRRAYVPFQIKMTYDDKVILHKTCDEYFSSLRKGDYMTPKRTYDRKEIIVGALDRINWKKDYVKHKYFAAFNDLPLKHFHENELSHKLNKTNIDFIGVGSEEGRNVLESIINKNADNGLWFEEKGDIEKSIANIAHYIKLDSYEPPAPVNYVCLDEEIVLEQENLDYEGDKIVETKWRFNHDPNYFENSLGEIVDNGKLRNKPITKFTKVGKYLIRPMVKDQATTESKYDYYNKWSENPAPYTLYVHRRPIADFDIKAFNEAIVVTADRSYDIDHQSEEQKGIVERKWAWFDETNSVWHESFPEPEDLPKSQKYTVRLEVKDKEGAWSKPCYKTFEYNNNPLPIVMEAKLKGVKDYFTKSVPAGEDVKLYDIILKYTKPMTKFRYEILGTYKDIQVTDKQKVERITDDVYEYAYKIKNLEDITTRNNESDGRKGGNIYYKYMYKNWNGDKWEVYQNKNIYSMINTPIWQDYSNGVLKEIERPIFLDGDFRLSTKEIDDRVNIFEIKTSKYVTSLREIRFNHSYDMSFYNVTEGTEKSRNDENYQYNFKVLSVDEDEFNKVWTFSLSVKKDKGFRSNSNQKLVVTASTDSYKYEARTYEFKTISNKPPVIENVHITPEFIYEGDNLAVDINVSDEDLDPLKFKIKLINSSGRNLYETTKNINSVSGSYNTISISNMVSSIGLGNYRLELEVSDPSGELDTYSQTIIVNELNLTGTVQHTPQWDENRKYFNLAKTNTENSPRGYDTFWSGERFILKADTTVIHEDSQVETSAVIAKITGYDHYKTHLHKGINSSWQGELWDNSMIYKWGNSRAKELFVNFTVYYSNGTIKSCDVPIIIDNQEEYFRIHRKQ